MADYEQVQAKLLREQKVLDNNHSDLVKEQARVSGLYASEERSSLALPPFLKHRIFKKIGDKAKPSPNPIRLLDIPSSPNPAYQNWLLRHYPRPQDLDRFFEAQKCFSYRPLVSIIMPAFNTQQKYLRAAISSVQQQVYPNWELCIADDNSTEPHVREILAEYQAEDDRIKVSYRNKNGHISACSNSALSLATGEFVALLDHDDLLTPDALYEVVVLLNQHQDADMIYSDEDKIQENGYLISPFFKPDWSPDTFLSRMYTSHLGVYRRSVIDAIGGFREGFEGAQDYDLVLRFTEKTQNIFHIPKVLYHWRIHPASTAAKTSAKDYATEAAKMAIEEALVRRREPGRVIPVSGGHHIVRYAIKPRDLVTIIIPTRDLGDTLAVCLESIFKKTEYTNYEVLVVDNGSTEPRALEVIKFWSECEPNRFRSFVLDIPFNYSRINNYAAKEAHGKYLLFLNNDTEVLTSDWIDAMVEQAQRPSIGAVGAKLLYPDNTIQHAGVICVGDVAGHGHKNFSRKAHGYFNQLQTVNNYSAVTAACLMCRASAFAEVNGFEEDLQVAFNDVDLCFKFLENGLYNVYLPHVELYHYESKSRGYETTPEKRKRFNQEICYMRTKWLDVVTKDRFYNPNLSKSKQDYSIELFQKKAIGGAQRQG